MKIKLNAHRSHNYEQYWGREKCKTGLWKKNLRAENRNKMEISKTQNLLKVPFDFEP